MPEGDTYNINIIRSAFKICFYYIMSFIIVPLKFGSSFRSGTSDLDSYTPLILKEIEYIRTSLNDGCDNSEKDNVKESDHNSDDSDYGDDQSGFVNSNIYSLKVDSIGRYDLGNELKNTDAIHINLKRKTIDISFSIDNRVRRIPLKEGQIVVTENRFKV